MIVVYQTRDTTDRIHRLSPRIEWRDLRDAAGLYRLSWRSGGSRFFCFVGRFEDRFMGLISSYQLINFEEKKKHAVFALHTWQWWKDGYSWLRRLWWKFVSWRVGDFPYVRDCWERKFLVIFILKNFGKSKGCYSLFVLEIIFSWIKWKVKFPNPCWSVGFNGSGIRKRFVRHFFWSVSRFHLFSDISRSIFLSSKQVFYVNTCCANFYYKSFYCYVCGIIGSYSLNGCNDSIM